MINETSALGQLSWTSLAEEDSEQTGCFRSDSGNVEHMHGTTEVNESSQVFRKSRWRVQNLKMQICSDQHLNPDEDCLASKCDEVWQNVYQDLSKWCFWSEEECRKDGRGVTRDFVKERGQECEQREEIVCLLQKERDTVRRTPDEKQQQTETATEHRTSGEAGRYVNSGNGHDKQQIIMLKLLTYGPAGRLIVLTDEEDCRAEPTPRHLLKMAAKHIGRTPLMNPLVMGHRNASGGWDWTGQNNQYCVIQERPLLRGGAQSSTAQTAPKASAAGQPNPRASQNMMSQKEREMTVKEDLRIRMQANIDIGTLIAEKDQTCQDRGWEMAKLRAMPENSPGAAPQMRRLGKSSAEKKRTREIFNSLWESTLSVLTTLHRDALEMNHTGKEWLRQEGKEDLWDEFQNFETGPPATNQLRRKAILFKVLERMQEILHPGEQGESVRKKLAWVGRRECSKEQTHPLPPKQGEAGSHPTNEDGTAVIPADTEATGQEQNATKMAVSSHIYKVQAPNGRHTLPDCTSAWQGEAFPAESHAAYRITTAHVQDAAQEVDWSSASKTPEKQFSNLENCADYEEMEDMLREGRNVALHGVEGKESRCEQNEAMAQLKERVKDVVMHDGEEKTMISGGCEETVHLLQSEGDIARHLAEERGRCCEDIAERERSLQRERDDARHCLEELKQRCEEFEGLVGLLKREKDVARYEIDEKEMRCAEYEEMVKELEQVVLEIEDEGGVDLLSDKGILLKLGLRALSEREGREKALGQAERRGKRCGDLTRQVYEQHFELQRLRVRLAESVKERIELIRLRQICREQSLGTRGQDEHLFESGARECAGRVGSWECVEGDTDCRAGDVTYCLPGIGSVGEVGAGSASRMVCGRGGSSSTEARMRKEGRRTPEGGLFCSERVTPDAGEDANGDIEQALINQDTARRALEKALAQRDSARNENEMLQVERGNLLGMMDILGKKVCTAMEERIGRNQRSSSDREMVDEDEGSLEGEEESERLDREIKMVLEEEEERRAWEQEPAELEAEKRVMTAGRDLLLKNEGFAKRASLFDSEKVKAHVSRSADPRGKVSPKQNWEGGSGCVIDGKGMHHDGRDNIEGQVHAHSCQYLTTRLEGELSGDDRNDDTDEHVPSVGNSELNFCWKSRPARPSQHGIERISQGDRQRDSHTTRRLEECWNTRKRTTNPVKRKFVPCYKHPTGAHTAEECRHLHREELIANGSFVPCYLHPDQNHTMKECRQLMREEEFAKGEFVPCRIHPKASHSAFQCLHMNHREKAEIRARLTAHRNFPSNLLSTDGHSSRRSRRVRNSAEMFSDDEQIKDRRRARDRGRRADTADDDDDDGNHGSRDKVTQNDAERSKRKYRINEEGMHEECSVGRRRKKVKSASQNIAQEMRDSVYHSNDSRRSRTDCEEEEEAGEQVEGGDERGRKGGDVLVRSKNELSRAVVDRRVVRKLIEQSWKERDSARNEAETLFLQDAKLLGKHTQVDKMEEEMERIIKVLCETDGKTEEALLSMRRQRDDARMELGKVREELDAAREGREQLAEEKERELQKVNTEWEKVRDELDAAREDVVREHEEREKELDIVMKRLRYQRDKARAENAQLREEKERQKELVSVSEGMLCEPKKARAMDVKLREEKERHKNLVPVERVLCEQDEARMENAERRQEADEDNLLLMQDSKALGQDFEVVRRVEEQRHEGLGLGESMLAQKGVVHKSVQCDDARGHADMRGELDGVEEILGHKEGLVQAREGFAEFKRKVCVKGCGGGDGGKSHFVEDYASVREVIDCNIMTEGVSKDEDHSRLTENPAACGGLEELGASMPLISRKKSSCRSSDDANREEMYNVDASAASGGKQAPCATVSGFSLGADTCDVNESAAFGGKKILDACVLDCIPREDGGRSTRSGLKTLEKSLLVERRDIQDDVSCDQDVGCGLQSTTFGTKELLNLGGSQLVESRQAWSEMDSIVLRSRAGGRTRTVIERGGAAEMEKKGTKKAKEREVVRKTGKQGGSDAEARGQVDFLGTVGGETLGKEGEQRALGVWEHIGGRKRTSDCASSGDETRKIEQVGLCPAKIYIQKKFQDKYSLVVPAGAVELMHFPHHPDDGRTSGNSKGAAMHRVCKSKNEVRDNKTSLNMGFMNVHVHAEDCDKSETESSTSSCIRIEVSSEPDIVTDVEQGSARVIPSDKEKICGLSARGDRGGMAEGRRSKREDARSSLVCSSEFRVFSAVLTGEEGGDKDKGLVGKKRFRILPEPLFGERENIVRRVTSWKEEKIMVRDVTCDVKRRKEICRHADVCGKRGREMMVQDVTFGVKRRKEICRHADVCRERDRTTTEHNTTSDVRDRQETCTRADLYPERDRTVMGLNTTCDSRREPEIFAETGVSLRRGGQNLTIMKVHTDMQACEGEEQVESMHPTEQSKHRMETGNGVQSGLLEPVGSASLRTHVQHRKETGNGRQSGLLEPVGSENLRTHVENRQQTENWRQSGLSKEKGEDIVAVTSTNAETRSVEGNQHNINLGEGIFDSVTEKSTGAETVARPCIGHTEAMLQGDVWGLYSVTETSSGPASVKRHGRGHTGANLQRDSRGTGVGMGAVSGGRSSSEMAECCVCMVSFV